MRGGARVQGGGCQGRLCPQKNRDAEMSSSKRDDILKTKPLYVEEEGVMPHGWSSLNSQSNAAKQESENPFCR